MQPPTKPNDTFTVWAKPGARQSELVGYHQGREAFEIRVAAQAQDGKANQELLRLLKETYGIECEIITGSASRKKRLRVL